MVKGLKSLISELPQHTFQACTLSFVAHRCLTQLRRPGEPPRPSTHFHKAFKQDLGLAGWGWGGSTLRLQNSHVASLL